MATGNMHTHSFLADGGEMGALIRAYDWKRTTLGDPATWPQALKTSIRLLLSTGHPMFIWWGPDLIQFYNDSYARSIGPERHPNALGQGGSECWSEIWEVIGPQIEHVMNGHGHTWHENQLVPITRHGSVQDVYWTYSYGPIDEPAAPNGVGGILVVVTETTEQVLAEQRLKAAEARWRSLFDQAPGFMCILRGPDHIVEFANQRYYELVGPRETLGIPLCYSLPEIQNQGFLELLDAVFQSGTAHVGTAMPVQFNRVSPTELDQRYVDFVYEPIRDHLGDTIGILIDGYDVTEHILAHHALREQDRRKDEFLAILGHELRNPLAPIRHASELLLLSESQQSREYELADIISRQTTQLTRLVDDLLDVSRITTGKFALQKSRVGLRQAAAMAIESVQPALRAKNHKLAFPPGEELYVNADHARLVQCITNVMGNAIKFTPEGGEIAVSIRKQGASAIVNVTDSGVGISAAMLPRVFELFSQDALPFEHTQKGLGIGLAVVREIVAMHDGEVHARSEGPDNGASFDLIFRLAPRPDAATTPAPNSRKPASRQVLIVDDNVDAADSLARLLTHVGHDVAVTYTPAQALASEFTGDVVILDIGLPGMDGYSVARRLRLEGFGGLLIAITGYTQTTDVQRALEAGFDVHLSKPVNFDALRRLLAT